MPGRRQHVALALQLPAAVLLLPDLEGTDSGGRQLALELGFSQVDMAHDGSIADHYYLQLGKGERLDDLLAGRHPVDVPEATSYRVRVLSFDWTGGGGGSGGGM